MARTQTVSLGNHWNYFIDTMLQSGRYASTSEIMRESLRLLEEKEANSKLEALRLALIAGEESDRDADYSMDEMIKEAKTEAGLVNG